ncbi:MAG: hypothetical protein PHE68_00115 [Candidatus Peribacteraceae bacterium]|nr:hypothetical protein [Candidatus Peribacteraceae bacterium]MDD5075240.1 hypothetical protein [Candidatus Peribacteraceae bacterium]
MAKRHQVTLLAFLGGILVGLLLGAAASQYNEWSAMLVARADTVYRNPRSVNAAKMLGIEDEGQPRPNYEWRTQRIGNPIDTHTAAPEIIQMYCPGQSALRRSRCLLNELNNVVQDLEEAENQ